MHAYMHTLTRACTHTHTHAHTGSETWPAGAYVCQWSGHTLGASSTVTLLPCLRPGEEANVSVSLLSPQNSGCFQSQWKMFTSGGTMCGGKFSLSLSLHLSPHLSLCSYLNIHPPPQKWLSQRISIPNTPVYVNMLKTTTYCTQ